MLNNFVINSLKYLILSGLILIVTACFSAPAGQSQDKTLAADYELLFIGNSHSASNRLPQLVAYLIQVGEPEASVSVKLAPGYRFLAERLSHKPSIELLRSRNWTHVILQAQKYSSSGKYFYPTDAAEEWISKVKAKSALPLLFPEWPRKGNKEEGLRVHKLHLSIAAKEAACVAPVGLAWDAVIKQKPYLRMHASDGNHAGIRGTFLTALVFYQVITGKKASHLPFLNAIDVSAENQALLAKVASETVNRHFVCDL